MRVESQSFKYLDDGLVSVSLTSNTGETISYTIPSAAFMRSIGLATQFVNANLEDFLADVLCQPGAEHVGGAVH